MPNTPGHSECNFPHLSGTTDFKQAIEAAARLAPIVGHETPSGPPVALAHYSRAVAPITAFARNSVSSWTDRVSDNPEAIGAITGLVGATFHWLYVIRRVTHPGLRHYGSGVMVEYAIDLALQAGEFVRLPLQLVTHAGISRYVVI